PVEDAPRRAVHAAMAIQKAIERTSGGDAGPLAARCAVHVGAFLVGHGGPAGAQIDLDGKREAWTLLETLVGRAEPDAVVASDAARPFLDRGWDLAILGDPGAPAAERVYRVTAGEAAGLRVGRRMVTFVGRTQELELLRSRLALATQGHGQM